MATRFHLPPSGVGTAVVSPAFDAGWEQTATNFRAPLYRQTGQSTVAGGAGTGFNRTVPITTTQDILCAQWVSDPMRAQQIIGTVSVVLGATESATTANVTFAVVIRVVSNNGATFRGTLLSSYGSGTEFVVGTTTSVGLIGAALTPVTCQTGDRLVIELGGTATAPTAATTYQMIFGINTLTDMAQTLGVSSPAGNANIEFSQNLFVEDFNSYKIVVAPTGISMSS